MSALLLFLFNNLSSTNFSLFFSVTIVYLDFLLLLNENIICSFFIYISLLDCVLLLRGGFLELFSRRNEADVLADDVSGFLLINGSNVLVFSIDIKKVTNCFQEIWDIGLLCKH